MLTKPKFYCQNHPAEPATFGCDVCKRTYCATCTKPRNFTYGRIDVCPACDEPLLRIEIPLDGQADSVGEALLSCLRFPISEASGRWTLFAGGLAFGLFVAVVGEGVAGSIARLIAIACLVGYAEQAIASTAYGKPGVPDWPDWKHWVEWITSLLRAVLGLVISFSAAIYLFSQGQPEGAVNAAIVVGALYWPMAWISATMNRSVLGFSPHVVLPAMLRTDKFYWVAVPFALALFLGLQAATGFTYGIPFVVRPIVLVLFYAFATYMMLVLGRMLGLVYLRTAGRFGW